MKAISLWQPWASLMAMGLKKIETRSWATKYRGPLLIHAAKKVIDWPSVALTEPFTVEHPSELPLGAIICKVDLIDCQRITYDNLPEIPEVLYGDYSLGRFKWDTENLEIFKPIPFRGSQGFFNVPGDIMAVPIRSHLVEAEPQQRKLW